MYVVTTRASRSDFANTVWSKETTNSVGVLSSLSNTSTTDSAQTSCMNTPKTQPKRERTDKEQNELRQAMPMMKTWARFHGDCRSACCKAKCDVACSEPSFPDHRMTIPTVAAQDIRRGLLLREEIALLDIRHEAVFATAHPLFAANMAAGRIALEAPIRLPRRDAPIVLYDDGEGLVASARDSLAALGYTNVRALAGGLAAWRDAGYEIFQDVNSYAKAFGELVEARRHTPSLSADEVAALIADEADIAILDVRRFDEYTTMNIPGSVSVPGAELVLQAKNAAPDPKTTIIVNCAGRTRSIIGTQSLINAGLPNKVRALRNGTMGWTLAKHDLEHGADKRGGIGPFEGARDNARDVAYRAGVKRLGPGERAVLEADRART